MKENKVHTNISLLCYEDFDSCPVPVTYISDSPDNITHKSCKEVIYISNVFVMLVSLGRCSLGNITHRQI